MKKLITALLILLSGCEGIHTHPNNVGGLILVKTLEYDEAEVRQEAIRSCESRNGTLSRMEKTDGGHLADNTVLGYYYFNFYCEPKVIADTQPKQYDTIDTSNIKIEASPPEKTSSPLDLSTAKRKCSDLGFKPKTEKFGKCVLELSK